MLSIGIYMGLAAMFCWGIADFLQATLAKKLGTAKTVLIGNSIGVFVTLVLISVFFYLGNKFVLAPAEILLLVLGCTMQAIASFSFIKAFEIGEVSIIAPISGTYSLVTVMLAVFFLGEVLTLFRIISIFMIVLGIILVSTDFSKLKHLHTVKGVKEVLLAVMLWGIYFFILAYVRNIYLLRTIAENAKLIFGMNLFLITNLLGGIFSVLIALRLRPKVTVSDLKPGVMNVFLANTVLYTGAWVAMNVGLVNDLVSLLAPVSSLYPAITVLLAAFVLKEKLVKNQYIGLFTIFAGIFLLGF